MPNIYQSDLAHIHIHGYGFHAADAAPAVLRWLRAAGVDRGRVVDLGCGGGQWLRMLADAGYKVSGVDISPSMIRAARRLVPEGELITGSFAEVDLPQCDAVTALGEPINYLDGKRSIRRVFRKVHQALRPGGLFVLDLREPANGKTGPQTAARAGDDWACIAVIEEDGAANSITRDIITFRQAGKNYRRGREVHRLKVYSRADTLRWLREAGFRVRSYRGFGQYRLGARQSAYVARKR